MSDIKAFELEQKTEIPDDINYNEIVGLSNELKIFFKFKPQTLRQPLCFLDLHLLLFF